MANFSFHSALRADVNVPATLDFGAPFVPQVQKILESAGPGLMECDGEVTVSGQAVAAILMVAGLEMVRGLPTLTLYGFGKEISRLGALDLGSYRHDEIRIRRAEIPSGEAFSGFTVLDGSGRGMTPEQLAETAASLLNTTEELIRVVDVNVGQVDFSNPTVGLVEKLLATGLNVADWSARRILYLPAGAGLAAAIQATAIHGLSESWPRTIRLASGVDKAFHVAEIVDPQEMRAWGTQMTAKWAADQTAAALAELVSRLAESGVNAGVEGGALEVGFPDGRKFTIAVTSANAK